MHKWHFNPLTHCNVLTTLHWGNFIIIYFIVCFNGFMSLFYFWQCKFNSTDDSNEALSTCRIAARNLKIASALFAYTFLLAYITLDLCSVQFRGNTRN